MMETASTASKSTALECLQVKLEEQGEDLHLFCTHEAKHHWRDGLQVARVGRNADAHLRCDACLQSVVIANVKPNLTSVKTCTCVNADAQVLAMSGAQERATWVNVCI
jgi:hypothetical protein